MNVIPHVTKLLFPGFLAKDAYFGGIRLVLVCWKITILSSSYAFHVAKFGELLHSYYAVFTPMHLLGNVNVLLIMT